MTTTQHAHRNWFVKQHLADAPLSLSAQGLVPTSREVMAHPGCECVDREHFVLAVCRNKGFDGSQVLRNRVVNVVGMVAAIELHTPRGASILTADTLRETRIPVDLREEAVGRLLAGGRTEMDSFRPPGQDQE